MKKALIREKLKEIEKLVKENGEDIKRFQEDLELIRLASR